MVLNSSAMADTTFCKEAFGRILLDILGLKQAYRRGLKKISEPLSASELPSTTSHGVQLVEIWDPCYSAVSNKNPSFCTGTKRFRSVTPSPAVSCSLGYVGVELHRNFGGVKDL